jgi:CDP-diacylglycerol--glycerol-3-phosphate 3-phosphatidyltransferase
VSGSIISPELRARVRDVATPIATGFGRLGLTPNHLTLIGFGIAVLAALAAARGWWIEAGLLVIVGGVFDLFDGALARATGRTSKLGAFMDSVFDRAGEAVVYVGIIAATAAANFGGASLVAASAMAASFMVSYVRAKSESLGFTAGTGMAAIGLAPREVRLVILTIGLILTGASGGVESLDCGALLCLEPNWTAGNGALVLSLGLIAILATITTIQRIVHVIGQASSKEQQ